MRLLHLDHNFKPSVLLDNPRYSSITLDKDLTSSKTLGCPRTMDAYLDNGIFFNSLRLKYSISVFCSSIQTLFRGNMTFLPYFEIFSVSSNAFELPRNFEVKSRLDEGKFNVLDEEFSIFPLVEMLSTRVFTTSRPRIPRVASRGLDCSSISIQKAPVPNKDPELFSL